MKATATRFLIKTFVIFLVGLALFSCRTAALFEQKKYYNNGNTIEFYSDNSYQFIEKTEGGYITKFNRGSWKQEGSKIFLRNEVLDPADLPISIRTCASTEPSIQLVVNILPKKGRYFSYLPSDADLINVELLVGKVNYLLAKETNIISFTMSDSGYFRAYYKKGVEKKSEALNDTLRSKYISLKGLGNNILSVDVDSNPMYFAQIKMADDTLVMVGKNRLKWKASVFRLPR